MIPVVSDHVAGYDYDASRQVLTLSFHTGGVYQYFGVPQWFTDEFSMPHPWRRVHDAINAYAYQQVA